MQLFRGDVIQQLAGKSPDHGGALIERQRLISALGMPDAFAHISASYPGKRLDKAYLHGCPAVGRGVKLKRALSGLVCLLPITHMRVHPSLGIPETVFSPPQ